MVCLYLTLIFSYSIVNLIVIINVYYPITNSLNIEIAEAAGDSLTSNSGLKSGWLISDWMLRKLLGGIFIESISSLNDKSYVLNELEFLIWFYIVSHRSCSISFPCSLIGIRGSTVDSKCNTQMKGRSIFSEGFSFPSFLNALPLKLVATSSAYPYTGSCISRSSSTS